MKTKNLLKLLPLLCLGFLISCGGKATTDETQEETKVKVRTTVAKTEKVEVNLTYTANVQAEVVNQIIPTVPGRIEKILVDIGTRVGKGQALVKMESTSLKQQQTQLDNLKKDYDRYNELLKVGGIAQQQVDQLKTQIDVLETVIKNLSDNTVLRSPISGIVTARNYDEGDVFTQLPILTVEQLNPLKAIINVSEAYFTMVKLGMPAEIKLDVYGDEMFTGKVSLIYPTIDSATHTFGVEVSIDNKDQKVRPGMYSRVTLNFGANEHIVVADNSVLKQSGSNDRYVYILENNIAKYRKVEVGQRLGDTYEIVSGIQPGEIVVTAGQTRLSDGMEVEIVSE